MSRSYTFFTASENTQLRLMAKASRMRRKAELAYRLAAGPTRNNAHYVELQEALVACYAEQEKAIKIQQDHYARYLSATTRPKISPSRHLSKRRLFKNVKYYHA